MAPAIYIIYKIRKYQRLIEKHRKDKDQILDCVTKLFKLPIEVGHIQETGIDKTVNSIRKFGGEVDGIVNSLIQKWKKLTSSELNLVANGEQNKRSCVKIKSDLSPSNDKLEPTSKLAKSRTHKSKSDNDCSEKNSETDKETKLCHHQKLDGNSDKMSHRDSRRDRKSLETINNHEIQKNNDDKLKKSIENVKEEQKIDGKSSNINKRKRDTTSDGEHKDYSTPKKQQRVSHIETDDHRSREGLVNEENKSSVISTTTPNASNCLRKDNTNTSSTAILEPPNQSIHAVSNANPLPIGNSVPCKQEVMKKEKYSLEKSKAFLDGITFKTTRTKLYSGVKSDKVFQPPSLLDHCTRLLQKDIAGLKYTGNVSFDIIKPVLEQATPQQLLKLEDHNPYLMEDSDSLWKLHVERHYPTQRRQNLETWREMFYRCQEEEKRELSNLTETFKQENLNEIPVRKVQVASDNSQLMPPRGIRCCKFAAIELFAPLTEVFSVRTQISNARRPSAWETMKHTMKVLNT